MCELLALSSSRPARLNFSLHTLASHGAEAGTTRDGWGVAFYQGKDVALFREPAAAGNSALVRFLETNGPSTDLAISHIRHATRGSLALANTQPFIREQGGRTHVFAHNGDLAGIESTRTLSLDRDHPVGQTDSEYAFCVLLTRLRQLWELDRLPALDARVSLLRTFAAEIALLGPANFFYADGDALFAYGHRRSQSANGRIEAPGLWLLPRSCVFNDAITDQQAGVSIDSGEQDIVLIASVPLTDEAWQPLDEGELVVVKSGQYHRYR